MIIGMLVILFFVKEPDSRLKLKADMAEAADEKANAKPKKRLKRQKKKE